MNLTSILCVCFAAITLTFGNQSQDGVQTNGDASYEFGYDIHNPLSNDIKSHHEVREGKNVLGFYTFREADGTIRVVKYKVTPDTGFEAVVEKLPDPLAGNSIEGQEASPSTHGAPETINEPNGGANSQYVAGIAAFHSISGNRNPRINAPDLQHTPAQHYEDRNPPVHDQRQRHVPVPQQHRHLPERYRNPHIIRRNPPQQSRAPFFNDRPRNRQHAVHDSNQRVPQETRYADVARGRQRNPQRTLQERAQPRVPQNNFRNRFEATQVQPYANEPVQPNPYGTGKIVYIDGVAYIDDIGLYSDPQEEKADDPVPPAQEQKQNPQYEVVENPEDNAKEEAPTNKEEHEAEEEKEEKEDYEEEDDDDEDRYNANYEEEEDDEDEDVDASDFYEENEQLINEQKEQYDRLKKAYEQDGQEPKQEQKEEEVQEEKQSEPVQKQ